MRLVIHKTHEDASLWAAYYIADRINAWQQDRPLVMALPTGSSPLLIYRELIRQVKEKKLSFANVHSFNLDEYLGLPGDHPQSYRHFMREHFFDHIDIDPAHTHIPDGMAQDPAEECRLYEKAIDSMGGIELLLGGMGSDGHIAFNEPGSSLQSLTRIVNLAEETRQANARFFGGDPAQVPAQALTMGVGTIMEAREVVIIVSGRGKARALRAVVEEGVNHLRSLSCLQMHPHATIVCDEEAVGEMHYRNVHYFMDIEKTTIQQFRERVRNNG